MRILITGGNGFIGTNLALKLLQNNSIRVRIYDHSESIFMRKIPGIEYIYGELGNTGQLHSALQNVDIVYHLASSSKPESSTGDPTYDVISNVVDTINMLEQCVKANVKRIVFISSGGTVYGETKEIPIKEDFPHNPICSYGITKLTIEKYLALYKHQYGLDYIVLRPSNPFGPFQNPFLRQGAVSVFLYNIINKIPIHIWGDGSIVRDYLYVQDLIDALLIAGTIDTDDNFVFNISSGKGYSLIELLDRIESVTRLKADVRYFNDRKFDVPVNILDNSLASQYLGWRPKINMQDGLIKTFLWMRDTFNEN